MIEFDEQGDLIINVERCRRSNTMFVFSTFSRTRVEASRGNLLTSHLSLYEAGS